MKEKRSRNRKEFAYYMPLTDATTSKLVGHMADISLGGFKLDSDKEIPTNTSFRFRLALTAEVANKPFMIFGARSKWCKVDPIDPFVYNTGFQVVEMRPEDREIFVRIVELYGKKQSKSIYSTPISRW